MSWAHDDLWNKSKAYMARALAVGPENDLFPFWSSLALELLARASLAKVHPALLADPRDGYNVLYACGVTNPSAKPRSPRSIPAHTLFERCKAVTPQFTREHEEFCLAFSERRNGELHSGNLAFEGYGTDKWLSRFYRICKLLLEQQGRTLVDFLGDAAEASAADEMILAADRQIIDTAKADVGKAASAFGLLDEAERNRRRDEANAKVKRGYQDAKRTCPACGADGLVQGTRIRVGDPRLEDDYVVIESTFLPSVFTCISCELKLRGYAYLDAAGLGGQYSIEESHEATEYYHSESADYEPEYDNE